MKLYLKISTLKQRIKSWKNKRKKYQTLMNIRTFFGFPGGSDGQESAYNVGHIQSLGWEDPLEEKGYPLQYSGLENSMDSTGME